MYLAKYRLERAKEELEMANVIIKLVENYK